MHSVKSGFLRKQLHSQTFKIVPRFFVGNHINRIPQNIADRKTAEIPVVFCLDMLLPQISFRLGKGVGFDKFIKNQLHQFRFLFDDIQLKRFSHLSVYSDTPHQFLAFISGRRCSAEPPPGFGKFPHIVPDTLGNRFPFQLREHRTDKHHGTPNRRRSIKLFVDRDKRNIQLLQFLNQFRKVLDITAHPVQTVTDHRIEFVMFSVVHHLFKLRALCVLSGIALVLINQNIFFRKSRIMQTDIILAHFNLVSNAFAFPGKLGFSGIDCDSMGCVCFHRFSSALCDDIVRFLSFRLTEILYHNHSKRQPALKRMQFYFLFNIPRMFFSVS